MAAFACTDQYDMTIQLDAHGDIKVAMPDDLFACGDTVKSAIQYTVDTQRHYYDSSLVKKYDVRNVPPKINTKVWPNLRNIIEAKHNTTKSVHPIKLIDHNIGSNQGLLAILRGIYEDAKMDSNECERYMFLNVDENIYWRIMKVYI
jgi:hypothetical protein